MNTVKIEGLDNVLRTLQKLPAEVASKRGGPVRKALRKGANVLRKEARKNFKSAVALPGKTGVTQSTGFTGRNIVTKSKPLGGGNGERMIVTVNYKEHISGRAYKRKGRKERVLRANDVAFMMEYGTSKQAATPWFRPAFHSKKSEAIQVATEDLKKQVDDLAKKYLGGGV